MKNRFLRMVALCGMLLVGCTKEPVEPAMSTEEENEAVTTEWSVDQLKKGLQTAIEWDKQYDAYIKSEEAAIAAIAKYGDMQREKYSNPEVTEIERKMEEEFQIPAVNLGEMDLETAQDIYEGCTYMFQTYPHLKGTLTDITLGDLSSLQVMALTRNMNFITNEDGCPMVVKREIILDASTFLDRERLLTECEKRSQNGYWPKNGNISKIIVHELGHQLLNEYIAGKYNAHGCYITAEQYENYICSQNDQLKECQYGAHEVMDAAYAKWSENNEGDKETFRGSISEYAKGIQKDGGVSLTETVAEAVADIYLNGEDAAEASKLIVEELMTLTKSTQ